MAVVYLHGDLAQFGGPYNLSVSTPIEAVRALCIQIKGFRKRLTSGHFQVQRKSAYGELDLDVDMLKMSLFKKHELHIIPVLEGSKRGGVVKTILGVAMVAAAFYFAPAVVGAAGPTMGMGTAAFGVEALGFSISYAQIAGFGAAMILGGIAQMISPTPSSTGQTTAETNASTLFSGPVNVTEQGSPIPLLYGRFCAGSVVVSSDIISEQVDGSYGGTGGDSGSMGQGGG